MQCIKGTILHTVKKGITLNNALFQNGFKSFCLSDYTILLQEAKELDWNLERILGLEKLPEGIDIYFKVYENINTSQFKKETINIALFESVKLKSGQIIRASNSFYNEPFFSDVSIQMIEEEASKYETDDGICYGKVSEKYIFFNSILY
jgi:hypothetical protein